MLPKLHTLIIAYPGVSLSLSTSSSSLRPVRRSSWRTSLSTANTSTLTSQLSLPTLSQPFRLTDLLQSEREGEPNAGHHGVAATAYKYTRRYGLCDSGVSVNASALSLSARRGKNAIQPLMKKLWQRKIIVCRNDISTDECTSGIVLARKLVQIRRGAYDGRSLWCRRLVQSGEDSLSRLNDERRRRLWGCTSVRSASHRTLLAPGARQQAQTHSRTAVVHRRS